MKNVIAYLTELESNICFNGGDQRKPLFALFDKIKGAINPEAQLSEKHQDHLRWLLMDCEVKKDFSYITATTIACWINSCK